MIYKLTSGELNYLNSTASFPYSMDRTWSFDDVITIQDSILVIPISNKIGLIRYEITFTGLWILYLYCETDLCL